MLQRLVKGTRTVGRPILSLSSIHTNGAGEVPKTKANTGSGTTDKPKVTHRTGPQGDGDMPHPQEYVDGIEPMSGSEQSPEKTPTRSTGIKTGEKQQEKLLLLILFRFIGLKACSA